MPAESRRRPRTYDPDRTWRALVAQVGQVGAVVGGLGERELAGESGLPGWDVRTLVAHVVRQIVVLPRYVAEAVPAGRAKVTGLDTWAVSTAGIADRLDVTTREAAAAMGDPAEAVRAAAGELAGCRERALRTDLVVPQVFGGMRALDFTVTRLVELVVHSDDLARATGVDVPLDRQAVAAVVRLLADALAARTPGNSVEVRIPPYAAVQCVPGPRHTRGTPPNVVETDPLTWIRLATGRTTWAEQIEASAVTASGERADLAPYLPVMR
ncbi:sterol carrier family protein [Actinacidiphila alni]|uniref:sterol carrier family protein n=1 Tax=Actinacidiphila alni TaxID=380248 RepID=UPI000B81C616|nr:sterol carrier family protein [Actinacidiphila alni]